MLYRVVKKFLEMPSSAFTLRNLAKKADVSISTSKRCLDYLIKENTAAGLRKDFSQS